MFAEYDKMRDERCQVETKQDLIIKEKLARKLAKKPTLIGDKHDENVPEEIE